MPLRHYTGNLPPSLDPSTAGQPPASPAGGQPPPVPPPAPIDAISAPAPELWDPAHVQVVPALPVEYQGIAVEITDVGSGATVVGHGPTVAAAVEQATALWDTVHVQVLQWADGTALEGLAQQVLREALELYGTHASLEPATQEMVGRLLRALGEEV